MKKKGKALDVDVGKQTNKKQLSRENLNILEANWQMLKQWKARNENSAGKETKKGLNWAVFSIVLLH